MIKAKLNCPKCGVEITVELNNDTLDYHVHSHAPIIPPVYGFYRCNPDWYNR